MTKVNWERASGEEVEEFVAALILEQFKSGNLVTPSKGDRGVDIRVPSPSGFDIYQVKRYTRPLTSKQESEITRSWSTFIDKTATVLPINSWKLVMPWDPTNERLEWLDSLTGSADFDHEWIGRTTLDVWAAQNPRLTDYYFGNGADRLQELMASALRAGAPLPGASAPEALLAAITEQAIELQRALDEVDPYYRYEIEVRAGRIPDANESLIEDRSAALVRFEQISESHYTLKRIFPRSPAAFVFRPITEHMVFRAAPGTPARAALEEFRLYGAPLTNAEADVVRSEGPPGATHDSGTGLISFLAAQTNAATLPPLELRLVDEAGAIVARLPRPTCSTAWAQPDWGANGSNARIQPASWTSSSCSAQRGTGLYSAFGLTRRMAAALAM